MRKLALLLTLALSLIACQQEENSLAQELASNEDFVMMTQVDLQLEQLITDGTIWIPPGLADEVIEPTGSLSEQLDAYKREDFRGFELYKELTIKRLTYEQAFLQSFDQLVELSDAEAVTVMSEARQLVAKPQQSQK